MRRRLVFAGRLSVAAALLLLPAGGAAASGGGSGLPAGGTTTLRIAGEVGGRIAELCLADAPADHVGHGRLASDPPSVPCAEPIRWDAQGRFNLAAPPGKLVRARFDGVGTFSTGVLTRAAPLPRLAPEPPQTFEIIVLDVAERPVIGARVYLEGTAFPWPPWRADRRMATTDTTGRVRLPYWPGEKLLVSVTGQWVVWQSKPEVVPDGRLYVVEATPRIGRTIQVLDARATRALPGAAVSWNGVPLGTTDNQGRIEVFVAPGEDLYLHDRQAGGWWLKAAAWQDRKAVETVAGGKLVAIGRIFGPDGRPAAGARIQLRDPHGAAAAETEAGEDGVYRFGPLAAAGYTLRASRRGFADALAEMKFGPEASGRVAAPDLVLGLDEAALGGLVLDSAGAPVAGAEIRVLRGAWGLPSGAPPEGSADARSDEDGAFLVGGLQPGEEVALEFRAKNLLPAILPRLSADGERQLEVVLEAAAELEVALSGATGAPVAGARVELATPESAPLYWTAAATTGADGRALFETLPVGGYELELRAPGYIREELSLTLAAGPRFLPIEMSEGASLEGCLRDETGIAVAGGFVSVRDPQAPTRILAAGTTDGDGRFKVAGIPQGAWRLEAAAPRRPPLVDTFEAAQLEGYQRDLYLPAGEALRGVVLDAGRAPVAGAQVTIVETSSGIDSANNRRDFVRALAVTSTDGAGAFGFEKLGRKRYSLSVLVPGGGATTQTVDVGGPEPFVEIVLDPRL